MTETTQSNDETAVEDTQEAVTADPQNTADAEAVTDAAKDAVDEGDIAADYLEELLDIVDLDGDIDIEIRGERTFISIQAEEGTEDLQELVGRKGEVLDALQELVRLSVLAATGNRTRLVLDINGHRQQRADDLKAMAKEAIDSVKSTGEAVHLSPMSAYERKIVHDVIAEEGFVSESEGEAKRRHVVVSSS